MSCRSGSPGVASARVARLLSLSTVTGYAAPSRARTQIADRDVVPAEVGSVGDQVTLAVDQAGHADGETDRLRAAALEVEDDLADQVGQPVEDLRRRERGDVEG